MNQLLKPSFLGNMKSAWSAGLVVHWWIALFLFSLYSVILLLYIAVGENPTQMTTSFVVDGFEAISPVVELTVGYWLLVSYLQAAATPLSYTSGSGTAIAYLTIHLFTSLIVYTGLLFVHAAASTQSIDIWPRAKPTTNAIRCFPALDYPAHLAAGWAPGVCPPLVYEQ